MNSFKYKLIAQTVSCVLLAAFFTLVGCTKKPAPLPSPEVPEVPVVTVEQKDLPVYGEWVGTTDGLVNADIKAQVSGYLIRRDYKEGSFVKKGQLLFEIDPRPFQAALDQAKGLLAQAQSSLAEAEANQVKTALDVQKYVPLWEQKAVTQQDRDNAVQANHVAVAQVIAAKAAIVSAKAQVETAALNLGFTRIVSLIDGITGIAQAQVGDLVGPSSGILTSVSTVDPIRVYFTMSEQEYLNFTKSGMRNTPLQMILSDGSTYPSQGTFFFANRQVNPTTGAIQLAALFKNPGNVLRPGQYARIRAVTNVIKGALLVPQRAVAELQDYTQVAVVSADNKINLRNVTAGKKVGTMWIITKGLAAGDRVVATGTQKLRGGMIVNPKPQ